MIGRTHIEELSPLQRLSRAADGHILILCPTRIEATAHVPGDTYVCSTFVTFRGVTYVCVGEGETSMEAQNDAATAGIAYINKALGRAPDTVLCPNAGCLAQMVDLKKQLDAAHARIAELESKIQKQ